MIKDVIRKKSTVKETSWKEGKESGRKDSKWHTFRYPEARVHWAVPRRPNWPEWLEESEWEETARRAEKDKAWR